MSWITVATTSGGIYRLNTRTKEEVLVLQSVSREFTGLAQSQNAGTVYSVDVDSDHSAGNYTDILQVDTNTGVETYSESVYQPAYAGVSCALGSLYLGGPDRIHKFIDAVPPVWYTASYSTFGFGALCADPFTPDILWATRAYSGELYRWVFAPSWTGSHALVADVGGTAYAVARSDTQGVLRTYVLCSGGLTGGPRLATIDDAGTYTSLDLPWDPLISGGAAGFVSVKGRTLYVALPNRGVYAMPLDALGEPAGTWDTISTNARAWQGIVPALDVNTPSIYPPSGSYRGVQLAVLKSPQSLPIYYTLDGTDPTLSSPLYTGPIRLTGPSVLKAKAFLGSTPSDTATATYDIQGTGFAPIHSYRDRVLPYLLEQYKGDNA